jgi:hypothetical protein
MTRPTQVNAGAGLRCSTKIVGFPLGEAYVSKADRNNVNKNNLRQDPPQSHKLFLEFGQRQRELTQRGSIPATTGRE